MKMAAKIKYVLVVIVRRASGIIRTMAKVQSHCHIMQTDMEMIL